MYNLTFFFFATFCPSTDLIHVKIIVRTLDNYGMHLAQNRICIEKGISLVKTTSPKYLSFHIISHDGDLILDLRGRLKKYMVQRVPINRSIFFHDILVFSLRLSQP